MPGSRGVAMLRRALVWFHYDTIERCPVGIPDPGATKPSYILPVFLG